MSRLGKRAALQRGADRATPPKILFGSGPPMAERPEEEDYPPPYVPQPAGPQAPAGGGNLAGALGAPAAEPPGEAAPPQPTRPVPTQGAAGGTSTATAPTPTATSPGDSDAGPPGESPSDVPRRSERSRRAPERFTSDDPGTFTYPVGQFPLRQVPGPNGLVLVHTPFNTTDLFNWKQGLPPYRESPQQYVDLVTRIISTHRPDIPDLLALLSALLNEEEKRQVMEKAYQAYSDWRRAYIQAQPRGDNDHPPPAPPMAEELLCLNPPAAANDPNTEFGRAMIEGARQAIKDGLRKGVPRVVNYQKVYNTVQDLNESPAEFLTRLKDAYRRHTDVDPDDPGNLAAIRTTFIAQVAPDIRRKLQKLPTPSAQPLETLVQTAFQVYYQRPEVEEAKADQKLKRKASLLAAALQPHWSAPPRDPPPQPSGSPGVPPGSRSCWNCGAFTHWVRDCPEKGGYRGEPRPYEPPRSYPPPRERREPRPPQYPANRGQPRAPGLPREEGLVPMPQGDRYPCGVRAVPSPAPRAMMAATDGGQD